MLRSSTMHHVGERVHFMHRKQACCYHKLRESEDEAVTPPGHDLLAKPPRRKKKHRHYRPAPCILKHANGIQSQSSPLCQPETLQDTRDTLTLSMMNHSDRGPKPPHEYRPLSPILGQNHSRSPTPSDVAMENKTRLEEMSREDQHVLSTWADLKCPLCVGRGPFVCSVSLQQRCCPRWLTWLCWCCCCCSEPTLMAVIRCSRCHHHILTFDTSHQWLTLK